MTQNFMTNRMMISMIDFDKPMTDLFSPTFLTLNFRIWITTWPCVGGPSFFDFFGLFYEDFQKKRLKNFFGYFTNSRIYPGFLPLGSRWATWITNFRVFKLKLKFSKFLRFERFELNKGSSRPRYRDLTPQAHSSERNLSSTIDPWRDNFDKLSNDFQIN